MTYMVALRLGLGITKKGIGWFTFLVFQMKSELRLSRVGCLKEWN